MDDNKKPENIQAFPMDYRHEGYRMEQGMTLRDYFANSAMQGMIANPNIKRPSSMSKDTLELEYATFSHIAYEYADAMLKQREL